MKKLQEPRAHSKRKPRAAVPITDHVRSFTDEDVRELMSYYRPLLKEIIRRRWDRRIQRIVDPSDAMQSTWISVAQSIQTRKFADRTQFARFLTRILRNQLHSIRRRVFAKKRSILRDHSDSELLSKVQSSSSIHDVPALDRIIQEELLQEIMCLILKLPRELQRLLRWKFRKGMSYREIAEKIGRKDDEVRYLVDQCVRDISQQLSGNAWVSKKPR